MRNSLTRQSFVPDLQGSEFVTGVFWIGLLQVARIDLRLTKGDRNLSLGVNIKILDSTLQGRESNFGCTH